MYAAETHGTLSESYRSAVVSLSVYTLIYMHFRTASLIIVLLVLPPPSGTPVAIRTCCEIVTVTGWIFYRLLNQLTAGHINFFMAILLFFSGLKCSTKSL